jgi:tetratricopeptide (TPR) repeat protein
MTHILKEPVIMQMLKFILVGLIVVCLCCASSPEKQAAKLIENANLQAQEGKYTDAAMLYLRACQINPTVDCYMALGQTYMADKEADKAIAAFGQALKMNPEDARGYLYVAMAHNSKSRWDKSLKALQAAYKKAGDQGIIYVVLADNYFGRGFLTEANKSLEYAQELNAPKENLKKSLDKLNAKLKELEPHRALGDSFMTVKTSDAYNRAYFMYKMIIDNNPGDMEAYKSIQKALKGFREHAEARKYKQVMKEWEDAYEWAGTLEKEEYSALLREGVNFREAYYNKTKKSD